MPLSLWGPPRSDTGLVSASEEWYALKEAKAAYEASPSREMYEPVLAAERVLAASRGDTYAEAIDIGAYWQAGAILPHIVSDGRRCVLVCLSADQSDRTDGADGANLIVLTFEGCESIRFGMPNVDVLGGHPLAGRGLDSYTIHIVRNSRWVEEMRLINSIHRDHTDDHFARLRHFLLTFDDETLEAAAQTVNVELVRGSVQDVIVDATGSLFED
jgi:hypothetical protein